MTEFERTSPPRPGRPATGPEAMLRVDHAGEYGAVRIYQGQLAVFGASERTHATAETIRKMAEQEQAHLDTFDKMLAERGVRPTALSPLWHVAGYALGAFTALLGEKAAMACTVAVEEVIDEHYARQERMLGESDAALKQTVASFRADELEHRDIALAEGAKEAPGYELLTGVIKAGCRLAIRLSERI